MSWRGTRRRRVFGSRGCLALPAMADDLLRYGDPAVAHDGAALSAARPKIQFSEARYARFDVCR
jgi:hypothetical protein